MRVKILKCRRCGYEVEATRNWRRDVQAHYNSKHKINKSYISASSIKQFHFIERIEVVSDKITEAPHYGTTTD